MKSFFTTLVIFTLLFLTSCSRKTATIVNRSNVVYDKNNQFNKEKYAGKYSRESSQEYLSKKQQPLADSEIEAKTGDTLYSISRKYNLTLRDLIKENNLTPPYNIKSGDRLLIPSPRYHEVKSGDTLYSISRLYNMKVDQLVEINELKEPYAIKLGEKLRINKFNEKKPAVVAEAKKTVTLVKKETKEEPGFVEKTLDKLNKFSWPIQGPVISKFGPKAGGLYNDGINILARDGAEVKAAEDGVVAYVGNELKGYGNLVILKHSSGWITAYAHLKDSSVKRGQKIDQGDKIGRVGASGNVTSPQLYFGLRKGRDAVNPLNYLGKS
jgi:murein DD-endopeptidase MepM/ murein hydrolase activator NlpD